MLVKFEFAFEQGLTLQSLNQKNRQNFLKSSNLMMTAIWNLCDVRMYLIIKVTKVIHINLYSIKLLHITMDTHTVL